MTVDERLDAHERAIKLLAHLMSGMDVSFLIEASKQITDWASTTRRNQSLTDAEKNQQCAVLSEVHRMLLPKQDAPVF